VRVLEKKVVAIAIVKRLVCLLAAVMLVLTACSDAKPPRDMGEIYSLALGAYMPLNEGVTGKMSYIAIDMSNLKSIDARDKQEILDYFKSYNVTVMEATYQELMEQKLADPSMANLAGVLLRVKTTEISADKVVVEGDKYRTDGGGISAKVVVEYKNGMWQVTKAES
jgi:hypothetical protein